MNTLQKSFLHIKTVCKHKWYVFRYCKKADITWQGIIHDLSKFSYTEFSESVKYADGKNSPIAICKKENGISYAWMHHKGCNPHHYEYWQDNFDSGTDHIKMPYLYALEQICDYLGAGRAYMGKKFSYAAEWDWWIKKKKTPLAMHPQTILFTDLMFETIVKENSLDVLKQERSIEVYLLADKLYNELKIR